MASAKVSKGTKLAARPAPKIAAATRKVARAQTSPAGELSWDRLLNKQRFRTSTKDPVDHRSEFERDYDRVVFSSSFRRLQDKTQVWPLEAHDFVRTRLTHSCEVAVIGRALALGVFGELRDKLCIEPHEPATAVATACLLHDIGNPPFGHTGEEHIARWFKDRFATNQPLTSTLTVQERGDLEEFEGNAHALRVATRLQTLGKPFGMNLTYGTLSSLMKYPWSSEEAPIKTGKKKKFGFFASEATAFEAIRKETGLSDRIRHPLAHLVEAADDIAYSTIDIEDGLKKRAFSFQDFADAAAAAKGVTSEFVEMNLLRAKTELQKNHPTGESQQLAFQQFRVVAIGKLIGAVVRAYLANYDKIMRGEIAGDLVDLCDLSPLVSFLKKFAADNVYTSPEVVKTERAAKHVVTGLLDILWDEHTAPKSKLLKILVRNIDPDAQPDCSEHYLSCQRFADYVAGMTDTFAFNLHARLIGVRS